MTPYPTPEIHSISAYGLSYLFSQNIWLLTKFSECFQYDGLCVDCQTFDWDQPEKLDELKIFRGIGELPFFEKNMGPIPWKKENLDCKAIQARRQWYEKRWNAGHKTKKWTGSTERK